MPSKSPFSGAGAGVLSGGSEARAFALRAGGLALLRVMNRGGLRVLAYHRFPASCAETLRAQCRYLRSRHQPVSLEDIDRWIYERAPLPANPVAVTVDDGYRDFYDVAYPIFSEYQIPVTVFLTTGFLDRTCWMWGDAVNYLFRHAGVTEAEIPLGSEVLRVSLRSDSERAVAGTEVKELAKRLDNDVRLALVYNALPDLLRARLPEIPPAEFAPVTWDEVREMYAGGIRFGGHTETHPILSSVRAEGRLAAEVAGAKRRLESEIDNAVFHFAYPNGTFADVNPEVVRHVREAGYRSAFLAECGANRNSADAFGLLRNMVEPVTPTPFFGRNVLRSR